MFRKYEKTYHIFPVTSKYNLDNKDIQRLLAGEVIVEEKMDGSNVAIIRHGKGFALQKRNSLVGASVHAQFDYFYNWANKNHEKIMNLPKHTYVYGELLYAKHHIFYDKLPEFFLVFDVRVDGEWLDYDDRKDFCEKYGFNMVPFIARGSFTKDQLKDLLPKESKYGKLAEGILVKRYAKHGYFKGKLVHPWVVKEIEEDENFRDKPLIKNKLEIDHDENVT